MKTNHGNAIPDVVRGRARQYEDDVSVPMQGEFLFSVYLRRSGGMLYARQMSIVHARSVVAYWQRVVDFLSGVRVGSDVW